jgi:hypothetical protein
MSQPILDKLKQLQDLLTWYENEFMLDPADNRAVQNAMCSVALNTYAHQAEEHNHV